MSSSSCQSDEIECNYPDDGCIRKSYVFDGIKECLRNGFDESFEALRKLINFTSNSTLPCPFV